MRCMALAEWAVELKAKVVVCISLDPYVALSWPCPVSVGQPADATVSIGDGSVHPAAKWHVIDAALKAPHYEADGYIYPHFGAVPQLGSPTFVGPQWMPLRKRFSQGDLHSERSGDCVSYRASRAGYRELRGMSEAATFYALSIAPHALLPASVIAYEALTLGCPVRLLDGITPACDEIGVAMAQAGVAVWDTLAGEKTLPPGPPEGLDGLGAKRLLEALL